MDATAVGVLVGLIAVALIFVGFALARLLKSGLSSRDEDDDA